MFAAAEERARREQLRGKDKTPQIGFTEEERAAAVHRVLANMNASDSKLLMVCPLKN